MVRILIHVMDKSNRNNREIFFCRFLIIGYLQNITHATNCADTRVDLQMLELAAQKGNIDFHIVVFRIRFVSPDLGCNLFLFQHLILIDQQKFEKLHFFSTDLHGFAGVSVGNLTGVIVKSQISGMQKLDILVHTSAGDRLYAH